MSEVRILPGALLFCLQTIGFQRRASGSWVDSYHHYVPYRNQRVGSSCRSGQLPRSGCTGLGVDVEGGFYARVAQGPHSLRQGDYLREVFEISPFKMLSHLPQWAIPPCTCHSSPIPQAGQTMILLVDAVRPFFPISCSLPLRGRSPPVIMVSAQDFDRANVRFLLVQSDGLPLVRFYYPSFKVGTRIPAGSMRSFSYLPFYPRNPHTCKAPPNSCRVW